MNHYKLVFEGTVAKGHSLAEVKRNIAKLFKADEEKIERLFTKMPLVLKKNLDYESALKYQRALQKTGAMCRLEGADHSKSQMPVETSTPSRPRPSASADTAEIEVSPKSGSITPEATQKKGVKGLKDIIGGVVLIGIGVVFGGSVFTGDPGWLDLFCDGLGVFWIGRGIYKMVR